MPSGALWSLYNPIPNKDLGGCVFWNNRGLIAAVQVARKDIAKGHAERHEAFREALVTDVKSVKERSRHGVGQVVHKALTGLQAVFVGRHVK